MADTDVASDSLLCIPANISPLFLPNGNSLKEKVLQKGLNYYTQGYIHNIKTRETENSVRVDARCWRSMRKSEEPHHLHVEVKKSADIISEAYCSCKVGLNGHCSHIVGLLKSLQGLKLHNFKSAPDQLSCTSIPQQWHKPRGDKIMPVPMNQIIVARPKETRKRKPVSCEIDENYSIPEVTAADKLTLSALEGTPLKHLMGNAAPNIDTIYGCVPLGSILSYQASDSKKHKPTSSEGCGNTDVTCRPPPVKLPDIYHDLNVDISLEEIIKIEHETKQQNLSQKWFDARRNRLTASNFGKVLKRKSCASQSFIASIFNSKSVRAAPLEYGKRNEKCGKQKYLKKFPSSHFHECGLVINKEFSFLGASPDGKICVDGECGIAEIKCPFSARHMTIEEACENIKGFFLEKDTNTTYKLKSNHEYYAQIQGQLMITGSDFCEFIVYTHRDLFVQRVLPDIPFMTDMLYKVAAFYKSHGPMSSD